MGTLGEGAAGGKGVGDLLGGFGFCCYKPIFLSIYHLLLYFNLSSTEAIGVSLVEFILHSHIALLFLQNIIIPLALIPRQR